MPEDTFYLQKTHAVMFLEVQHSKHISVVIILIFPDVLTHSKTVRRRFLCIILVKLQSGEVTCLKVSF